jgi:uncharacterized protein (TIGR02266 family)
MDQSDRRSASRIPHLVEIRYASDSPVLSARVTDVSEKGLFVDSRSPLAEGSPVTFSFSLNNSGDNPITGAGKVVWRQETVGMGIEFTDLSDENRAKIRQFIGKLAA